MEIRLGTTLPSQLLAIISHCAETLPLAARQRVEKEFYEALGFVRDDEPRREGVRQLLAYRLSFARATDTRPE